MDIPIGTLLILGCLTLLIPAGMTLHACGLSRSKNAASALLRNVIALAVAVLAFWAIGAAILFGSGSRVFGFSGGLVGLVRIDSSIFAASLFFHMALVLVAVTPLAPALGERARIVPVLLGVIVLAALVVPMCGYWTWAANPPYRHGWLHRLGFIDPGGATAIQLTGGLFAAVGAMIVGARSNKYNTDGSANMIPGHSLPLASGGLLLAVVGWIAYLVGASILHRGSATQAAINTLLAASAATIVTYGMSRARYGKPDVLLTLGGLLAGLVSITAGAGVVNPIAAVAIGAIGGMLVLWASVAFDSTWRIDDPSGAVAAHVVGGVWGTLAVGLFAPQVNFADRMKQIGVQSLGVVAIAGVAVVVALVLFSLLKRTIGLRISEADEYDGIDLAEHDLNAYPDFQQTMIKSYHLREA